MNKKNATKDKMVVETAEKKSTYKINFTIHLSLLLMHYLILFL